MKTFFHTRAKWLRVLAPLLATILLIGGYSAIANARRADIEQASGAANASATAQIPVRASGPAVDRDDDAEFVKARREYLNWYLGATQGSVSPADYAKTIATVRALPPSPLLQGRKFVPPQPRAAAGATPSWTSPIPPPIGDVFSADSKNSAVIRTLGPDPVDSSVVYAGGNGGFAKSSNGGQTWQILSDNWDSQSVTSIAIDPNAPSHVYVGTGNGYALYGVGLYRSTDGGANWTHLGETEFAGTVMTSVAVDPHTSGSTESTTLYVAADRSDNSSGLWRSTDGGAAWSRPLARPYNGIWSLALDPSTNPSTLYIADSNGVSKSTDGINWTLIYTSNANWNGGVKLSVVNSVPYLLAPIAGNSPIYKLSYYSEIGLWTEIPTLFADGSPIGPWKFAVDPADPNGNIILIGTAEFYRTTNRGGTWENIRQQQGPNHDLHVDVQTIEFSPALAGLVYVGNDGGIWKSLQNGSVETWENLNQNLPGVLLYSVALSQDGSMIAGTQDNGTVLSDAGGIWKIVLGGDSNRNLIDPIDSNTAYYTSYWANYFQRYNKSTRQSVNIRPSQFDSEPCNFFPAFSMNRFSPTHLIAACQHLVRSTNQGTIWTTIGGSLADPTQPNEWWNTVNTTTESPSDSNVIYAVATGGRVLVTADADQRTNAHWTNVTGNLGEVGGIYSIAVHPTDPQMAYLACGAGVYKTTTMGAGTTPWVNLHAPSGPPGVNFGYRDLIIDPDNPDSVIVASQMGVFATVNDGASWENMSAGMPAGVLVSGLSFDRVHRKLAASTYGRGVYILDLDTTTPPPTPTPTLTPEPTPTPTPTATPTPTPMPTVTPPAITALGNISTRLRVETGDNVLIGGFIVTGTEPKRVIVRAMGPSLPLAGALADPILELRDSSGSLIRSNDDWRTDQETEIIATGIPPSSDLESALVATLPANSSAYTAIVRGVNNATGIGVVEAYDLDRTVDSKLANISTRGFVQTGDDVLIAGTIVLGQTTQRVLVRAIGPSLSVPGKMANPILELRDGNGVLIRSNDNWRSDQEAEIMATGIPPTNDLESALVETLPANGAAYTAIVRGVDGATGIAVVEVYGLN